MGFAENIEKLRNNLSPGASINLASEEAFEANKKRWSEYKAPQPGAIVNVATESDIEQTVKWAIANDAKFLAQAGGHGFSTSLSIGEGGIIINLRGMRAVTVDEEAGTAVISAGTIVSEAVDAVHRHKSHISTGSCNSVGVIGATLGGGVGRLQGKYGLAVDNIISARLVTAQGESINVSATENPDLWWGLRGAGHNFGIVSSLTMKIYPQINGGQHWMSTLIFTPDKIEVLMEAIDNLDWDQDVAIQFFFLAAPPDFRPAIVVSLWYPGPEEPAKKVFSSLFTLGAVFEQNGMTPYDRINADADPFCEKGGQKPTLATSIPSLKGPILRQVWDLYIEFIEKYPQAGESAVLFECHPLRKVMDVADGDTVFPHRALRYHGLFLAKYTDPADKLDAEVFGERFRSILREGSGSSENHVYVNFAIGNEKREEIYGAANLGRLRELKKKWDPKGCFNQYHPIC